MFSYKPRSDLLSPQNVRTPPIIQRKSDTPTEPVTAKIPEGVEKTVHR